MKDREMINWRPSDVRTLEQAIDYAKETGRSSFRLQGHLFDVAYATYLAQYLREAFAKKGVVIG